jgi:hypothetical protein
MKNEFAAWQGTNARRNDVTAVVFRLALLTDAIHRVIYVQ